MSALNHALRPRFLVVALIAGLIASLSIATIALADNTPPDTPTIDAPTPDDPTNDDTPTFFFSGTDPDFDAVTFYCDIDGGGYAVCTSGDSFGALSDGSHTFSVKSQDIYGSDSSSADSYTWFVDTTEPDTFFTQTPPAITKSTTKQFKFDAVETGSGLDYFECNLDGGGWATCTSPYTPPIGLPDDYHTLEVRATDLATNVESTPASYTWLVDTTKPVVTVVVTEYTLEGNFQYDPFEEPNRWARHSVTIDFICVDPSNDVASGVATNTLPQGYAISTDGKYSVLSLITSAAKCQDVAGNRADLDFSGSIKVNVDQNAPTCSVTPAVQYIPKNNPANSGQTYLRSVTVAGQDGDLPANALTIRLLSVTGPGAITGWNIGSQTPALDLNGRFEGNPNAIYTITYEVEDPAGFTSTCKGKVKTANS